MSQREEAIAYFEACKQRTTKWLPPEGTVARAAIDTEIGYYDRAIESLSSEPAFLRDFSNELANEIYMYEFLTKKGLTDECNEYIRSRKAEGGQI